MRAYCIHPSLLSHQSTLHMCMCSSLLAYMFAQSRVSVCSLEQSTCYTFDWNRSNRSRNYTYIVLIAKKGCFFSRINIIHPCTRLWSKCYSMRSIVSVNLDVLEWANMNMNALHFLNPFFSHSLLRDQSGSQKKDNEEAREKDIQGHKLCYV